MSVSVQSVYDRVCDAVNQPGGLQGPEVTEADFLAMLGETWSNFLTESGLLRRIDAQVMMLGVAEYEAPDDAGVLFDVFADELYLNRTTHGDAAFDRRWRTRSGRPERWFDNDQAQRQFTVVPRPGSQGGYVEVDGGGSFLGTLSGTTDESAIQVESTEPFYGVISAVVEGPVHVETPRPMYGTVSRMVGSRGNLLTVSSALPWTGEALTLDDTLWRFPVMFQPYLKYGVLHKIFSTEGELKDSFKARYCRARYEEGLLIAQAMLGPGGMDA